MGTARISMVVATKDRPDDLRRLLASLAGQSEPPFEVVIVDASAEPVEGVVRAFAGLRTVYLRHRPPSASAQRNAGVAAASPEATLVGFCDDDTTFEADAYEQMHRFWREVDGDVLGAAFNIKNYELPGGQALKRSRFVEWLGLYDPQAGHVAQSGWQTVLDEVQETRYVAWLPSCAAVWRREALEQARFDEYYDGYSYLEDLDFSYGLGKKGRLAVVAEAGYQHFPSPAGRGSQARFGYIEVRNRLHFVRKHRLSMWRCWLGLGVRFLMSAASGSWGRFGGNLRGVWQAVWGVE